MKSETELQKEGIDYLRSDPRILYVGRAHSGKVKVKGGWMSLFEEGTPDLMGVHIDGKAVVIEYKTKEAFESKNHGASNKQVERLMAAKKAGCYAGIACCVEHVKRILGGECVGLED